MSLTLVLSMRGVPVAKLRWQHLATPATCVQLRMETAVAKRMGGTSMTRESGLHKAPK